MPIDPLASIFRAHCHPLTPEPTIVPAQLAELTGIRAVLFDVYGTLFISGVGDISLADKSYSDQAVKKALVAHGVELTADGDAADLGDIFHRTIEADHSQRRAGGTAYPEVEIREIWSRIGQELLEKAYVQAPLIDIETLAIRYECEVNKAWAMPGLEETLGGIHSSGRRLGIISNAQFFTPLLFQAFLRKGLGELGFTDGLCIWSYQHRTGKPGTALYEHSRAALAQFEITPEEVLYVGNDMRNDIWPAQTLGFKTALFAGDARSLRLRRDLIGIQDVVPDLIITDLRQILDCLV